MILHPKKPGVMWKQPEMMPSWLRPFRPFPRVSRSIVLELDSALFVFSFPQTANKSTGIFSVEYFPLAANIRGCRRRHTGLSKACVAPSQAR